VGVADREGEGDLSFDYAAWAGLRRHREMFPNAAETVAIPESARSAWSEWMPRVFAGASAARLNELNPSLPGADHNAQVLLLGRRPLDKALYEVVYELNSRPNWAPIPLPAVRALTRSSPQGGAP